MKISVVMEALTGSFVTDVKRARSSFERDMKRMQREAQEAGRAIGVAIAAGAAIAAVALKTVVDEADKLGEMSDRLGLSTEEFTSMGYAAKLSGIEIEKFAAANRNLGLRLEKNEELFAALDVSTRNADGTYRSTTDIIRDLAGAFAEMPNGVEKSRIAAELFGSKLGNEMIPLLNQGSENLAQMERDADTLGATLSGDTAEAASDLADQLDRMKIMATALIRLGIQPANEALKAMGFFAIAVTTKIQQLGAAMGFIATSFDRFNGVAKDLMTLPNGLELVSQAIEEGPIDTLTALGEQLDNIEQKTVGATAGMVQGWAQLDAQLKDIEQRGADLAAAYDGSMIAPTVEGSGPVIKPPDSGSGSGSRERKQETEEDRARAEAKRALADAERAVMEARLEGKLAMQDARKEEADYYEQMISDMESELELMKMSNVEAQTAIQLRGASAEAVARYGEEIAELNRKLEEEAELVSQMDGLRNATQGLFEDLISGTKSAKEAFQDFANAIIAQITRIIAQKMVERLFGDMGSTGGGAGGGFATAIFGAIFGGGKATGGAVLPGRVYQVNEQGPEMLSVGGRDYLMMGKGSGMVTPNHRMGSSIAQTVNFLLPGRVDTRTQAQIAADAGRASQRAIARA